MKMTQRGALGAAAALACLAFGQQAQAQSSISFTGVIDAYAGSLQRSGETGRTNVVNSSGMTTSWWGFKGVEDLGGGLQAQFNLTGFFRPDNGGAGRYDADTLFARDANVGLAGGFGRFSIGRDLAPNFVPSITLNPFGGSFAFAPLLVHTQTSSGVYRGQKWAPTTAGDTGWSNEIMYVTPNMGGLTASLFYQFGEQAGNGGKNNVGANAMYGNGPLTLGAYVQRIAVNNPLDATAGDSKVFSFTPYNIDTGAVYKLAAASRQTTWFIGGAYDFKAVKVFGTWQQADNRLPDGADHDRHDLKSDTAQLGASAPLGAGVAMFSWARSSLRAGGDFGGPGWRSAVRRNTVSLGYDYLVSKRTDVYSVAMRDRISDQDVGCSVGVGIRHKF
ncbi:MULTISPECIES: porin [unclassified Janthinobacterium]|uniref:porin n=1 Tax=unclassified Janthinobacterium TaxID=2610881 RepID=UPI00088FD2D2|nr:MULTISPECIES: porin [unclassified Janthinobacterium]SDA55238.1 Outer membrane protein (porin) [Janthinobacterium sp. 551a]SFB46846.1 Outer membrane protein (porin) [Janthinobacterium sp. 344]